jgi:hypothetical protein
MFSKRHFGAALAGPSPSRDEFKQPGRRRGAIHFGRVRISHRRDGELKMDWTKPLHNRSAYGY